MISKLSAIKLEIERYFNISKYHQSILLLYSTLSEIKSLSMYILTLQRVECLKIN